MPDSRVEELLAPASTKRHGAETMKESTELYLVRTSYGL